MSSKKHILRFLALLLCAAVLIPGLSGCTPEDDRVIIYSNADEEALTAIEHALDAGGYQGQYILQSFATSELGGRLMAEGTKLEADIVTMSTYYLEAAQQESAMFSDLTLASKPLEDTPAFATPITVQEAALMVNTEVLAAEGLAAPASIADLAKPEYAGLISVPDIEGSSTGWLLVQSILGAYGEDEAAEILTGILKNAGPHLESSGSGPFKKVKAGEVAVAFGLRHQSMAAQKEGLPIDTVDPAEGNYALTESLAVVAKGDNTNPRAEDMAECILQNARAELLETYPRPLYAGEAAGADASKNPKTYPEALTTDLLQQHQEFFDRCAQAANQ
ncbi:MAG: ABC transporter substrate-binding protein [Eubacterium sp.]|nr:ABC transporter substrate-binding protein [Eubacterium sp.]